MNALNPDFVVVTGDLIDGMHKYKNNEFAPLSGLNVPSFFVLGNHEQFISLGEVYELLSKTDLKIMRNRALVQNGIQIVGIDDTSSREEFRRRLAGITIDHNRFSLLLYHRPNGFDAAADAGIDLMLSGHTHGGQIFPLNILLAVVDGPVRGLHRKKDTHLYVSTGAGWWGAPMRLGSRNELVVIDLIPKKVEEKIEEKETEDLERKEEHMEAVLNEKPGGRGKSQYKGKGRKGGKEKHREKIKKALFVNKDVDDAQIVSLRRGKRALRESKHEHILFSVDRLVEDIEMKQKLGRRKRKKPAKPAKKATGKTKKAGKKQGGVKKQAPKRTKIKNKRRM
jgi:predicted phosphodiesterase